MSYCTRHNHEQPCFECVQERRKILNLLPLEKEDVSISKLYPRGRMPIGTAIAVYCTMLALIVLFWGLVFDGFAIFR